jgi:hypothetical protein
MATRFVRPFHARIGKREKNHPPAASNAIGGTPHILPEPKNETSAGASAFLPPLAENLDGGTIKVQRDDVRGIQERREPSHSPPPRSHNSSIKVQRDKVTDFDERREPCFSLLLTSDTDCFEFQRDNNPTVQLRAEPSLSPPLKNSDHGSIKVARDVKADAEEHARAPLTPRAEPADDVSINVVRNDHAITEERSESSLSPPRESSEDAAAELRRNAELIIEELEREPQFARTPASNRRNPDDERLSTGTIVRIAAALIVLGLGFAALLPSALTRDTIEPAMTLTTSTPPELAEPAQTEHVGAVHPVLAPRPSQPTEVVEPAPTPDDFASVVKTTPALRGSGAFEERGEGRAPEEVLVPRAGKGAGRTPLTAAEKAAVMRGLQELEKRAAVATPRLPAPTRPRLTAEEKAAVERGLRELEKTASP